MITREALEVRIDGERVSVSAETLEKYNRPGPRVFDAYLDGPEQGRQRMFSKTL